MKTIFLILATSITSFVCHATTYTCSNNPVDDAQFLTLDDAYVEASPGDTILLEKSYIPYNMTADEFWGRRLTVIGIGINPAITDDKRSIINLLGASQVLDGGASGSKFYGITFEGVVTFSGVNLNDIIFENCSFESGAFVHFYSSSENIFFINTIFKKENAGNLILNVAAEDNSIHVLNCIFNGYIYGNGASSYEFTVDHCMFLNNAPSGRFIQDLNGATISNCIFVNSGGGDLSDGVINCTFLNNIYNSNVNADIPPPNNFGSGNQNYDQAIFTNFTFGEAYSPNHDYTVIPTFVGINAATDGTDIGVHGGFTNFNEALEPSVVPIVTSTTILDGGTEVGGTIELNVQARKPLPE